MFDKPLRTRMLKSFAVSWKPSPKNPAGNRNSEGALVPDHGVMSISPFLPQCPRLPDNFAETIVGLEPGIYLYLSNNTEGSGFRGTVNMIDVGNI